MIGFIYLWYDRASKMYYLGSRKGAPTDTYKGSGSHFIKAYRKRPEAFKRRIIQLVYKGENLKYIEDLWLKLVFLDKRRHKYMNLNPTASGYTGTGTLGQIEAGRILGKSMRGTMLVTNGYYDKRIKRTEQIPEGFCKGSCSTRRGKHVKGRIWIRLIEDNDFERMLESGEEIPEGWEFGRAPFEEHAEPSPLYKLSWTEDRKKTTSERMAGNQNLLGYIPSEDTKLKISKKLKGKKLNLSQEERDRRAAAIAERNRMRPPRRGKKNSARHNQRVIETRNRNASNKDA